MDRRRNRALHLNQTDGTMSVINAQTNLPDILPGEPLTDHCRQSRSGRTSRQPATRWSSPRRHGVHAGSVSIISIPLCSANALPTNPNCDPNNPVDAVGFGTVLATVPVGINPRMVGVLQDGTRAYVVNAATQSALRRSHRRPSAWQLHVSVINLNTNTVTGRSPFP